MGRIDPLDEDFLTHPALPFSLLVAATAATIAIISSFCAFWRTPEPDLADSSETAENSPDSDVPLETEQATAAEEEEEATQALPPPPCMRALTMTNQSARTDRCSSLMKKSVSARRISSASVKKHFRSISVREIMDKNKHKPDDSHSLCQKHIILGGKCKVGVQVDADANADADAEKKNTGPETQSSLENPDAIADKVEEEQGFGF